MRVTNNINDINIDYPHECALIGPSVVLVERRLPRLIQIFHTRDNTVVISFIRKLSSRFAHGFIFNILRTIYQN